MGAFGERHCSAYIPFARLLSFLSADISGETSVVVISAQDSVYGGDTVIEF